ncbi:hypothetical protein NCCP1664_05620 [Zafaria cholistanensis]|uniref:Uncharacterized protein n=1 Tax=Zafaria cholistanensis TaxID=1682741 RepID=A0A5A7NMD1_9MICC|nr:hypothetical protein NCCP1664_05620 [Zafaria cholistanensis]
MRAVVVLGAGIAEGPDPQVQQRGQDPPEFGHMDPGAAIDRGREFFGNNVYAHVYNVVEMWPFP